MKRINVLTSETSNKIAAGEVVERPASVVKELVENSIDAEAKNISVEIFDGGQESIKITDDGIGIHPDDVEKAFMTHATSKIMDLEDIYKITTLGFRGEALPSIASVSKMILKTRRDGFDFGKEIRITAGEIEEFKEIGCSKGTVIEVRNLFFNVPARQKFLKSSQREASLISDILMRLALSNPNISFKLFKNGKKVFSTYGTDDLKETIRCLYGKEVYNNITNFEKHTDIASIHGYIGNSEISRGSRNRQSIFINKRLIKNKMITAAVENAFKSFLTINKFPFFVLFIDIYPEYIDVNVHPTKSEIKFQDDRGIFKVVFDSVHEALRQSLSDSFSISFDEEENDNKFSSSSNINTEFNNDNNIKNKNLSSNIFEVQQIPIDLKSGSEQLIDNDKIFLRENIISNQNDGTINSIKEESDVYDLNNSSNDKKDDMSISNNYKVPNFENLTSAENNNEDEKEILSNKSYEKIPKFPQLNIIGQFNKTYIIGEIKSELYIIDQHAAHEKILFEKYREELKSKQVVSQLLLTPSILELHPDDFILYKENEEIFKESGFMIETFGENTISIREVPIILGKPDIKNLFMEILDNLKNMGTGKTEDVKYDAIARMACRSAIKANDRLSNEEMEYLINNLRFIENPFTCPHGRPTIIKFTLNELEKKFKRIQ